MHDAGPQGPGACNSLLPFAYGNLDILDHGAVELGLRLLPESLWWFPQVVKIPLTNLFVRNDEVKEKSGTEGENHDETLENETIRRHSSVLL